MLSHVQLTGNTSVSLLHVNRRAGGRKHYGWRRFDSKLPYVRNNVVLDKVSHAIALLNHGCFPQSMRFFLRFHNGFILVRVK
jgi:hypothetical protein